jgi:hypothetical protein
MEQLSQMNDHLLRDIGLTKTDVCWLLKTGETPARRFHPGERKRAD